MKEGAKRTMATQAIYTRTEFDKLPQEAKKASFTVSRLKNIKLIRDLHKLIAETLDYPNEKDAWEYYLPRALKTLNKYGMLFSRAIQILPISFRMARQNAYIQATKQLAETNKQMLHGYQYKTKDDPGVRWNHEKMHDVIRPINDPVWEKWTPPNGFACRCWYELITKKQYQENPEKYQYTEKLPNVAPDEGFD